MKAIFHRLWVWFTGSSVSVLEFLLPIIATGTAQLLVTIGPIVANAVLAANTPGKSGDQKRAEAFDQIKAQTVAKGLEVSASIINVGIELAVDKLKAKGQLK